jgi:EAL domain-containing protein (putative c-di-GMP-specific phosphodiesterase class I)
MAHSLGLLVVAEGVETQEQLDLLKQIGCKHFQGYLFGRPVPLHDFEQTIMLTNQQVS